MGGHFWYGVPRCVQIGLERCGCCVSRLECISKFNVGLSEYRCARDRERCGSFRSRLEDHGHFVYRSGSDGPFKKACAVTAGEILSFNAGVEVSAPSCTWFATSIPPFNEHASEFAWLAPGEFGAGAGGAFVYKMKDGTCKKYDLA